jgi:hypothetical protein
MIQKLMGTELRAPLIRALQGQAGSEHPAEWTSTPPLTRVGTSQLRVLKRKVSYFLSWLSRGGGPLPGKTTVTSETECYQNCPSGQTPSATSHVQANTTQTNNKP